MVLVHFFFPHWIYDTEVQGKDWGILRRLEDG